VSKKRKRAAKTTNESVSFGRYLAGARREKGWDLDDLQKATKVSHAMLDALENEDFEQLPARVYVRGFVRSCAQALGLDTDELLGRYERARRRYDAQVRRIEGAHRDREGQTHQPAPATVSADHALEAWAAAALRRKADRGVVVDAGKVSQDDARPTPARATKGALSSSPRRVSLALVLLLIVVALTLTLSYVLNRPQTTSSSSGTPAATETANSSDWTG